MRVLGDILCYDIIIIIMIIKTVSGFPCYKQYLFSFYFKGTKWRESSGLQSTDWLLKCQTAESGPGQARNLELQPAASQGRKLDLEVGLAPEPWHSDNGMQISPAAS